MEALKQSLTSLVIEIKRLALKDVADGVIVPQEELYLQYQWEKFDYSKTGIQTGQGTGKYEKKLTWIKPIIVIYRKVTETPAYLETLALLTTFTSSSFNPEHTAQKFIIKIIEVYLEKASPASDLSASHLVDQIIEEIHTGSANVHGQVALLGITLESEAIQLAPKILLRRSNLEDISAPIPLFTEQMFADTPFPTAILEIETSVKIVEQQLLQQQINRYVDILKLFGYGGIYMKKSSVNTNALVTGISSRATLGSNNVIPPPDIFYLDISKEEKLKAFFQYMTHQMPDLSGFNRKINNLTISFERYSDACTESKIFERGVMNAIMGLEALYLNDNAELSYKLAMRCSKALANARLDPVTIKKTIKAGYTIRSKFAHGDHLDNSDLKKFDTQFGDYRIIAKRLCDYLSLSICAKIIVGIAKNPFLDLLDSAMLTDADSSKLRELYLPLGQYLPLEQPSQ
jgi:hypothetical protein